MYTPSEITDIVNLANSTLWNLAKKSERSRVMRGEDIYESEVKILYSLKRALEYAKTQQYADAAFHQFAAYVNFKCSSFGFDGIYPYYAAANLPISIGSTSTSSGWVLYKQMIVGDAGAPAHNAISFTDPNLINRNVYVVLDSLALSMGLTDRQSYTINAPTGTVTFTQNLNADQVIQLYIYVTGAGAWTPFEEFTVGASITTYTNSALIGKNIIVDVDGSMIPRDLLTVFSFSFDPLLGTITWNAALSSGQHIKIYVI